MAGHRLSVPNTNEQVLRLGFLWNMCINCYYMQFVQITTTMSRTGTHMNMAACEMLQVGCTCIDPEFGEVCFGICTFSL